MTRTPVAVVIPALDEAERIGESIRSAQLAGAAVVIVSDGGSTDTTRELARAAGATVIEAGPPRGHQLNAGAALAPTGHALCFLHADSRLPRSACDDIRNVLTSGRRHGGFLLEFQESDWRLRTAERMINLRSRLGGGIWGDQAQFFDRAAFESLGGYREIPIMEDYEMMRRARVLGAPALIHAHVTTSGRRFLERGLIRTSTRNWLTIARFHAGVPVEKLATDYRRSSRT